MSKSQVSLFVETMLPHARALEAQTGIPAHISMTQAALETGWGRKLPMNSDGTSSNNYFGIKGGSNWGGKKARALTNEEIGGRMVRIQDDFRSYDSPAHSLSDWAALLEKQPYAKARQAALKGDAVDFGAQVSRAGYATDSAYPTKFSATANTLKREIEAKRGGVSEDLLGMLPPQKSQPTNEGLMALLPPERSGAVMLDGEQRMQRAYDTMAKDNSFLGNVRDGMATAAQRYALGGSQMMGRATPEQKQELQFADKAFGSTVGGKIGDFIGTALPAVAATFVPGGNTIAGQALIAAGMGAAQPADSMGDRATNAGMGALFGAGAKIGGDKLASYMTNQATQKGAALTAQNLVRDGTIAEARAAGYTIPPSSANPSFLNRALEGFAGKISTAQSAAIKNQSVTDNLARKALGLADDVPLTKDTLQSVRATAGQMYAPVEALGRINTDAAYRNALQAVESRFSPAVSDFPELANKEIGALVKALNKPDFDSSSAVQILRALREKATDNLGPMASGSDKVLGRAQKDLAAAVESMIERHAQSIGQTDAVQALREARTLIAKSYTVEKALREGAGSVSASKLAGQLKAGKPLTDELLTAAKVGQVFPRATQDITSSMPGVSPLDFGLAGGLSAITANPMLMATVAGRPAVRAAILSQPYQRAMVSAPSYGPGLLGSAAPPLLRNRAAQMALTGGLLDAATR